MPEILVGSQLFVDALRLEDNADLPTDGGGILGCVKTHDQGAAGGRHHQCRKNAEQGGLAAAVGAE